MAELQALPLLRYYFCVSVAVYQLIFPDRHLEELHAAHNKLTSLQVSFSLNPIQTLVYGRHSSQGVDSICPVLEFLDISSNHLDSIEDLQPLAHLPSLTDLLLQGNPLCRLRR